MAKRYQTLECIGSGGFGEVHTILDSEYRTVRAIKLIPAPKSEDELFDLKREISLLERLSHPNIIKIQNVLVLPKSENPDMNIPHGSLIKPPAIGLVMEYCRSDVKKVLDSRENIDGPWNWKVFGEIVDAINYIHSRNVIHRDLKPENILLSNGQVKIADFGLAKGRVLSSPTNNTCCGTPRYMAPEVWTGSYDKSVDLYSLAVIMLEMYTERTVFNDWIKKFGNKIVNKRQGITPFIAKLNLEKMPKMMQDLAVNWIGNSKDRKLLSSVKESMGQTCPKCGQLLMRHMNID